MVKINNENEVAAYHVIRVFAAIVFVLYVVSNWIIPEYFGLLTGPVISKVGAAYAIIYLLGVLYIIVRGGIWYLEFLSNDEYVEFRFYYLTAPFGTKNMIRIGLGDLYAYKLEKSNFGLKDSLVLYQDREGKLFQYPPIPIGSFVEQKRSEIIAILDKYAVKI